MNKTAKEGVKRGKNRAAHKKQKVAPEGMTNDEHNSGAGENPSKPSRSISDTFGKEQNDIRVKVANGRLPPLVPPTKVLQQKSNDIELHDRRHDGGGKRKPRKVGSEEAGLESLSVVKDKETARTPSPAKRRRNENMTSYERMLQREKRKSKKISGSYTILQSEPEEEVESCNEQTNPSGSCTSLRSRASTRKDPNQALLQYFAKLSSSPDADDSMDLEHIQSLLHEGASVNTSDRFGQTLLHEVSRTWGVDVAQFFIEQGKRCDEQLLKPPDETREESVFKTYQRVLARSRFGEQFTNLTVMTVVKTFDYSVDCNSEFWVVSSEGKSQVTSGMCNDSCLSLFC